MPWWWTTSCLQSITSVSLKSTPMRAFLYRPTPKLGIRNLWTEGRIQLGGMSNWHPVCKIRVTLNSSRLRTWTEESMSLCSIEWVSLPSSTKTQGSRAKRQVTSPNTVLIGKSNIKCNLKIAHKFTFSQTWSKFLFRKVSTIDLDHQQKPQWKMSSKIA